MKQEEFKVYFSSGPDTISKIKPVYQEFFGRSNVGEDDIFFIAESNDLVIGIVRFCVEESTPLLRSMLVVPNYRGKGIGRDILKMFEKYLMENKISKTWCIPFKKLEKLYSEIGFISHPTKDAPLFLQERLKEYQQQENDEIIFMVRP
jgi:N-acetylglutamate synthase-like GNAT family acetyltransferase